MDKLPKQMLRKNAMFILNTDTSNLPGQHWIAVIVRDNVAYCFDPLGSPPPTFLAFWLNNQRFTHWSSNTRQIQPSYSNMCGQFCVHFLYFASASYMEDTSLDDIVNVLYPVNDSHSDYEYSVMNSMLFVPSKP